MHRLEALCYELPKEGSFYVFKKKDLRLSGREFQRSRPEKEKAVLA